MAKSRLVRPWLLIAAAVVAPARAERLPIRVYTTADGLAGSVVLDVFADSPGFIAEPIPFSVTALHIDGSGRLWISSSNIGVRVLHDPADRSSRVDRCGTAEGLSSNNVQCIVENRWGRIYFGSSRGIDRLDPATGRFRHFTTSDGLASGYVVAAARDESGALWFGTHAGVSRLVPVVDAPAVPEGPTDHPREMLTPHELRIVRMLADGDSYQEIGDRLGITREHRPQPHPQHRRQAAGSHQVRGREQSASRPLNAYRAALIAADEDRSMYMR